MSKLQHKFLNQVNGEIRRLGSLIDSELSGRIDSALAETLAGEPREKAAVNILVVLAIQLMAGEQEDQEAFENSIVYGGLLSQLITHYWHQMKAMNAASNTHEAPNAAQ